MLYQDPELVLIFLHIRDSDPFCKPHVFILCRERMMLLLRTHSTEKYVKIEQTPSAAGVRLQFSVCRY